MLFKRSTKFHSLLPVNPDLFTFLVPTHPHSHRQEATKWVFFVVAWFINHYFSMYNPALNQSNLETFSLQVICADD